MWLFCELKLRVRDELGLEFVLVEEWFDDDHDEDDEGEREKLDDDDDDENDESGVVAVTGASVFDITNVSLFAFKILLLLLLLKFKYLLFLWTDSNFNFNSFKLCPIVVDDALVKDGVVCKLWLCFKFESFVALVDCKGLLLIKQLPLKKIKNN